MSLATSSTRSEKVVRTSPTGCETTTSISSSTARRGRQAIADSAAIRRLALQHKVCYTTTLSGGIAFCTAIREGQSDKVRPVADPALGPARDDRNQYRGVGATPIAPARARGRPSWCTARYRFSDGGRGQAPPLRNRTSPSPTTVVPARRWRFDPPRTSALRPKVCYTTFGWPWSRLRRPLGGVSHAPWSPKSR